MINALQKPDAVSAGGGQRYFLSNAMTTGELAHATSFAAPSLRAACMH